MLRSPARTEKCVRPVDSYRRKGRCHAIGLGRHSPVTGGDLLLLPAITSLLALPPTGASLTGNLPDDEAFCGFEVDVQAIEADAGAAKGVSFTPGLQLLIGK